MSGYIADELDAARTKRLLVMRAIRAGKNKLTIRNASLLVIGGLVLVLASLVLVPACSSLAWLMVLAGALTVSLAFVGIWVLSKSSWTLAVEAIVRFVLGLAILWTAALVSVGGSLALIAVLAFAGSAMTTYGVVRLKSASCALKKTDRDD